MPSSRQLYGHVAEDRAVKYLSERGYRIIDRHVTSRYGEIDIVAMDGPTVVAIEVKARRGATFGSASEAITMRKIARIMKTLRVWQERSGIESDQFRVDAILIDGLHLEHVIGLCPVESLRPASFLDTLW